MTSAMNCIVEVQHDDGTIDYTVQFSFYLIQHFLLITIILYI